VGYKIIQKGKFVADDAIDLELDAVAHVLGGRFVCKDGMHTTGPVSDVAIDAIESTNRSMLSDWSTK
jgi:hypothetical protein